MGKSWQALAREFDEQAEAAAVAPAVKPRPQTKRGYEAARRGRRAGGWSTIGRSANAVNYKDHRLLRERSRDAIRNVPHARKGIETLASDIVGTGIIPRFSAITGYADGKPVRDKDVEARASDAWEQWVLRCVSGSNLDGYGFQMLMCSGWLDGGDAFMRERPRRMSDGLRVPVQVEGLEADFCPHTLNEDLTGDGKGESSSIVQGVEFNAIGQLSAYYFHKTHPGNTASLRGASKSDFARVPAASVAHLFRPTRLGQVRGVPHLATVLMQLKDIARYQEAVIVNLQASSSLAAFVHGDSPFADTTDPAMADAGGLPVTEFAPGMVVDIGDRAVTMNHVQSVSGQGEYIRVLLHEVAAGLGITYEKLTGDLSQVNYSSLRAGLITYQRIVRYLQQRIMVPMLCRPMMDWFLKWAQASGVLPAETAGLQYRIRWQAPAFESVDPLKDAMADRANLRNGTVSPQDVVEQRTGASFESTVAEIEEGHAAWDAAGIVSDADPRKTTAAGQPRIGDDDDDAGDEERGIRRVGDPKWITFP